MMMFHILAFAWQLPVVNSQTHLIQDLFCICAWRSARHISELYSSTNTCTSRCIVPHLPAAPAAAGRLVVHKPDLPPSFGVQEGLAAGCPAGLSPRSSRYASVAALRAYPGPNVFAIPGNQ
jgi:hypothetical protein